MTSITETTRRTVASETYRGRTIEIVETVYAGDAWTSRGAHIDGRVFRCPKGTDEQVLAKLRKYVDTDEADAAILPRLLALVANAQTLDGMRSPISTDDVPLGREAWVYAMGQRRRGIVTKHGRSRVEVAYTTASSGGRVFRKSVPLEQAWVID